MSEFLWDEPIEADLDTLTGRIARAMAGATSSFQPGGVFHVESVGGPITIAVYGPWGSGKTTLLRHIQTAFQAPRAQGGADAFALWFEPWRYEREENLIVPLLIELTASVASRVGSEKTKQAAIRTGMKLIGRVAKASARTAASFLAERVGLRGEDIEKIGEDFLSFYEDDSGRFSYPTSENEAFRADFEQLIRYAGSGTLHGAAKRPVCIFIDDLDRCSAAQVRRMLESMKNFLWADGVTYVLALDREQVTLAVAEQYLGLVSNGRRDPVLQAKALAKNYLEKFFLYTFDLDDGASLLETGIVHRVQAQYWAELLVAAPSEPMPGWDTYKTVYDCTLPNLRRLKRVARWLYYESALAEAADAETGFLEDDILPRFAEFVLSENYSELWLGMLANANPIQRVAVYSALIELLNPLSTLLGDPFGQVFSEDAEGIRAVLNGASDVVLNDLPPDILRTARRLADTPASDLLTSLIDSSDANACQNLLTLAHLAAGRTTV